jgi:hypothetical protein
LDGRKRSPSDDRGDPDCGDYCRPRRRGQRKSHRPAREHVCRVRERWSWTSSDLERAAKARRPITLLQSSAPGFSPPTSQLRCNNRPIIILFDIVQQRGRCCSDGKNHHRHHEHLNTHTSVHVNILPFIRKNASKITVIDCTLQPQKNCKEGGIKEYMEYGLSSRSAPGAPRSIPTSIRHPIQQGRTRIQNVFQGLQGSTVGPIRVLIA